MQPSASYSLLTRRATPAVPYVLVSIGLHAAVVIAAILWGMFGGSAPMDLDQKPIKASLVRLGKPRDQKLLPRKEELPPPPKQVEGPKPDPVAPKPPEKSAVAVPIPGVKPETKPAPSKQAGEKTGNERRNALFSAFGKASAKPEDLEGAEDGDPFGDSAVQEGERYYGAVTAQVRRYYDVSQTISEQERMFLKAEVFFRVDRRGSLMEVKLSKPSGNTLFDSAVVAAVKKAAPFAPPPEHLRDTLEDEGVILEFKAL